MCLGKDHLERLAAAGLLVSERFPEPALCPGGFRIFKARRDGLLKRSGDLWASMVAFAPADVQQVTEATDLGVKVRQALAAVTPLYVVEGTGLWVHEEDGRWWVYDGEIYFPGGIRPSFRWAFDSADAAVEAILGFLRC